MTNLTMKEVVPFFEQYKAKFNEECELSVDVFEQILEGATSDEDAMLQQMYDTQHSSDESEVNDNDEDTDTNETDDRSTTVPVDTSPGSAFDYASRMDDQLANDLETSANAALENKRGAAVIALDLERIYGHDTIVNTWPVPGSKADAGTRSIGNRVADKYKAQVRKEDGTTAEGERSWYQEYIDNSPRGKDLLRQLDSIKAVKAGEDSPIILEEHKAYRNDARMLAVRKAAIEGKRNNAKAAIVRAVNLLQRIHFLNTQTEMVAELIKEDDAPVKSQKLIYVYDKKDQKKFNILTIGQLLALKVIDGGTYAAISGTTNRAPKSGTGPQEADVKVDSIQQFDKVTAAYANFIDRINEAVDKKDLKAYNAFLTHLNADGSGDLILSMNSIMEFIEGILSKPTISRRLADLLAKDKKQVEGEKKVA
jgi:hypothetical protein